METLDIPSTGTTLRTYAYGKGEPIVLVHGGPGCPGYMRPIGQHLESHYRIVEYYQRGCSFSPAAPHTITVENHIRDLHEVIQKTCTSPPILIGSSWGAALATLFALRYPAEVKKLILIGTATFSDEGKESYSMATLYRLSQEDREEVEKLKRDLQKNKDPLEQNALFEEVYSHLFPAYFAKPPPSFSKIDCVEFNYEGFKETMTDFDAHRNDWMTLLQGLSQINVPIVAIHGEDDPHPYEHIEQIFSQYAPDFTLQLIPQCGHYPWLEPGKSEAFFHLLDEELKSPEK